MKHYHKTKHNISLLKRVGLAAALAGAFALSANTLAAAPKRIDMSRLVVIGDSLMAGYQNGSLMASQQKQGIAALIAAQAKTELPLPLIAEPGIPNVLTLVRGTWPPTIVPADGTSSGRIDILTQPYDLAVPGHRVIDALEKRPDFPIDSMTDIVLGLPGMLHLRPDRPPVSRSQVEWAEALQPSTILVWIGNNDALNAAIASDTSVLTPVAEFETAYSNLLQRLDGTGASLVVANIPDVMSIPFVLPVPVAAAFFGAPLPVFEAALGVSESDFINLDNLPTVGAILLGAASGPLAPNQVLDAGEIELIRHTTDQYNAIIATQAAAHRAVLVDTHGFVGRLAQRGVVLGGRRMTTQYLGGIFSLDGVHPSNTGAALTANYFIRRMNTQGAAHIPPVNVRQIQRNDALVP